MTPFPWTVLLGLYCILLGVHEGPPVLRLTGSQWPRTDKNRSAHPFQLLGLSGATLQPALLGAAEGGCEGTMEGDLGAHHMLSRGSGLLPAVADGEGAPGLCKAML